MPITTPIPPIPPGKCWGWIGLGDLPAPYLAGGPRWLADRCREVQATTGCAGIVQHLPFGHQGIFIGTIPQYGFCQAAWLRAKSRDHARLVNGYAAAMAPLAGVVLPYLGSLRLSPELNRLSLSQLDDRMRLLAENIKPVVEAGIRRVGIDGSVDYEPDSPDGRVLAWWESMGLTVWRESNPADFQTWAHDRPVIVSEADWQARRGMFQYATVKLTGPVVRFVAAPNGDGLTGPTWGAKWATESAPRVRAVLADGHTPAVEALDLAMKFAPECFA